MSTVTRVENHIIKKSDPLYNWILEECLRSRNLFNRVLYIYRQAFTGKHENIEDYRDLIKDERFVKWTDVRRRMAKINDVDYRALLKSHSANRVIAQVDSSWNEWFENLKDFKKNPSKYTGRPKMPKYKKGEGVFNHLVYDDVRIQKDGTINISRNIKLPIHTNLTSLQEVRLIPRIGYIKVEIVYRKEIEDKNLDKSNAIGIDIGLNNLMAITSNTGAISHLVNGRHLKAINQYYNKKKAHYMSILNKHGQKKSHRLENLEKKRHMKINDYLHKASRRVVDMMEENNIGTCYIGHNKGWKQEANMGKKNNQNFVQIPFNNLIQMIQYKTEEIGCNCVELNESHTSKCSALDYESIGHHEEYVGKRTKRGLFRSSKNSYINADINGSLNILRRGLKTDFEINNNVFRPSQIDIESKGESCKG